MSGPTNRIKNAYDEWAEIYDTNHNKTRDLNYRCIRQQQLDLKNKKVLEIGCGTGLNTIYLAGQAKKVIGIDISEEMLARARVRLEERNAEFIKADITKPWQLDDAAFDFIVGNLVLEHIENLTHVFSVAFRVLKDEGKFYVAELHPYRQLQQSQAKFRSQKTGEEILVDAFTHPVSEYINEGLSAGFILRKMGEEQKEDEKIPRLLTLLFKKGAQNT